MTEVAPPVTRPPADRRGGGRWRFLLSPGWITAGVLAVGFAIACYTVLAPWQFGRNAERAAQNNAIAEAANSPVQPIDAVLPPGGNTDGKAWRQVTATGEYLSGLQVVVRLRQNFAGQPSSQVVTPLQLSDGSVVLVNRGDVDVNALAGGAAPPPAPSGEVTVTGRLQAMQPDPLDRAPQRIGQRTEVYGIDRASMPPLPGPLRDGVLLLMPGQPGVFTPIEVPQLDAGPFLAYAWQWLIFGTMGLLAFGYFAVREATDPREPVDSAPAAAPRAAPDRAPERRRRGFDRSQLYDTDS
nr:SURF1 family cytochrome oxidase biogenesis protein [Nakamurella aerolata]